MKNLLVLYSASGRIKSEMMSASEVILLNCYIDVEITAILNVTDRLTTKNN